MRIGQISVHIHVCLVCRPRVVIIFLIFLVVVIVVAVVVQVVFNIRVFINRFRTAVALTVVDTHWLVTAAIRVGVGIRVPIAQLE
jgi:hypothetical protein